MNHAVVFAMAVIQASYRGYRNSKDYLGLDQTLFSLSENRVEAPFVNIPGYAGDNLGMSIIVEWDISYWQ